MPVQTIARSVCKHGRDHQPAWWMGRWADRLTHAALKAVLGRFPAAMSISLAGRAKITDARIKQLVACYVQLCELNLGECLEVTRGCWDREPGGRLSTALQAEPLWMLEGDGCWDRVAGSGLLLPFY